jgi:hypothetical protein
MASTALQEFEQLSTQGTPSPSRSAKGKEVERPQETLEINTVAAEDVDNHAMDVVIVQDAENEENKGVFYLGEKISW